MLTEDEAEALARVLLFLWPRSWLKTEAGVWRAIILTRVLLTLAFLLVLAVIILAVL